MTSSETRIDAPHAGRRHDQLSSTAAAAATITITIIIMSSSSSSVCAVCSD